MFVPDSTTVALSRATTQEPARAFNAPWPTCFVCPADSVYREHTPSPSALQREHPRPSFGLSGTRCCYDATGLTAKRSAALRNIPLHKPAGIGAQRGRRFPIRPIRNTQPQTRRFPFRSIRNTVPEPADFEFGLSGTLLGFLRWLTLSKPFLPFKHHVAGLIPSKKPKWMKTRCQDFRPIGNTGPQNPSKPFRSIRNNRPQSRRNPIRSIRYRFGLSGTKLRTIRNESSAYQERIFGLSGTHPRRKRPLSQQLALLTGGLTFLTPLTSLTSPAPKVSHP